MTVLASWLSVMLLFGGAVGIAVTYYKAVRRGTE